MKHKRERTNRPPRFSAHLLAWLLDDDWETPAGDFEEYFHQIVTEKGEKWARWWYRRQVLAMMPGRLAEKFFWGIFMFFSSLKVVLRSMRRRPLMAVINIGGLAVGLAAFLLVALYVQDELTFDDMHTKSARIARIIDIQTTDSGTEQHQVYTMNALGPTMVSEIPEVTSSVRVLSRWVLGRQTVRHGDNWFYEGQNLTVDSTFFDLFDFRFLEGNRSTALAGPGRVVLTASAARRYFGDEDPMGNTLTLQRQGDFTVTAIIEDPPPDTHFDFSMLCSLSTMHAFPGWTPWLERWDTAESITYVLLTEDANLDTVQAQMDALIDRMVPDRKAWLQPMKDIHFGSSGITYDENAGAASSSTVFMLLLVGLFILLIAAINYTNITLAGYLSRTREVGLRLTSGAWRSQLARQFMGESVATTILAGLFSLVLVWPALSTFNGITGKQLALDIPALSIMLGILLIVGIATGLWPARIMSSIQPADVLKGGISSIPGGDRIRGGLVVLQFTLSIGLIVSSLVVNAQLQHVQTTDLGFDRDHLIVVDINSGAPRANFRTVKADFAKVPSVERVSVSSNVPGDWKNISQIDVGMQQVDLVRSAFLGVDADFLDTFQIELVAGRNLDDTSMADSLSVLITQTTARILGTSVGDRLVIPGTSLTSRFSQTTFQPTVVGIVADFHYRSLHEPIGPMVLGFHSNPIDVIDYFTVRVAGTDLPATINALKTVGERHDPDTPFEYNFLDERMQDFYVSEARLGSMMAAATGLAIFLACLGLFALSAYMTVRRTKEIGVRKVLGASVGRVVLLLSTEFLKPVAAAFIVSIPVTWFVMNRWLESFAFRAELGPGIFALAGGLALVFALVTVSWHTVRAARRNPAESLKYE